MAPQDIRSVNFSKTQRLVLLIDLHPLLTLEDPTPYITVVKSAAGRLLGLTPLSAAVSAYRFFFSSLSPLEPAALLTRHPSAFLSFNLANQTLNALFNSLDSIRELAGLPKPSCSVLASNAASSLLQLINDYAWETETDMRLAEDDFVDEGLVNFCSNFVFLFSPIIQSVKSVDNYLDMREISVVFGHVKEALISRDIHLCWIDVKTDEFIIEASGENQGEPVGEFLKLRDGMTKMGWSICSSNLLVLISSLLPLELIYPKIGSSSNLLDIGAMDKENCTGNLSLMIKDKNGLPLECQCCRLDFKSLKCFPDKCINSGTSGAVRLAINSEYLDLHIESFHRYDEIENSGVFSEILLVKECYQRCKSSGDILVDKVLELLHFEMAGIARSQIPIWQIILSFLHTKGYCALVCLSNGNGDKLMASLKPLTTHLALLYVFDVDHTSSRDKISTKFSNPEDDEAHDEWDVNNWVGSPTSTSASGCYSSAIKKRKKSQMLSCADNDSNICIGSQTSTSTSCCSKPIRNVITNKIQRVHYKEMKWSSFCKSALEGLNFDLFGFCFDRLAEKSKKLKFIKCWMKQACEICPVSMLGYKNLEEVSSCNEQVSDLFNARDDAMTVLESETSERLYENLSERMKHGIESGMDLQSLAERVIKSSISWLSLKGKNESDPCRVASFEELVQFLLISPKAMKKFQPDSEHNLYSDITVREYELQIFLRLEIMRSPHLSKMVDESRKTNLLKQVCSLLEIIQYLVAGGIHSQLSLYDYIEENIKSRYSDELEDVVADIYVKMDLLPFGEEDETPSFHFNSEDSNQSWRENNKHDVIEKGDETSNSAEDSSLPSAFSSKDHQQVIGDEDERNRVARVRREQSRRFAPFFSRARDLQRVWAPKQPTKVMKCKGKKLKGKKRGENGCSVVCETPITTDKNGGGGGVEVSNSSVSISRALFQDRV